MDKGIYTALSGGIAKGHDLEVIANNLANSNTPGFKRDTGTFNEYLTELRRNDSVESLPREILASASPNGRPTGDKSFVEMDAIYTDFRSGDIHQTGRNLDVAIEGEGFFEVLTPSGIRYTRQGNFNISKDGLLVSVNGYPVLSKANKTTGSEGKGGAFGLIGIKPTPPKAVPVRDPKPEERMIRFNDQGSIDITVEGRILQNGAEIAQLNIEEFHENQWLEKSGNAYFRNTSAENLKNSPTISKTHQGMLEGSNVNPVSEMTRLIEATRAYESHLQAIKTHSEIDQKTVNEIAKE